MFFLLVQTHFLKQYLFINIYHISVSPSYLQAKVAERQISGIETKRLLVS